MNMFGTNVDAVFYSGAILNPLSAVITDERPLKLLPTNRRITASDAITTIARGIIHEVQVNFGYDRIPCEFLVVEKSPFAVIIGCHILEILGVRIDLGYTRGILIIQREVYRPLLRS